jgi:hypothetical protein
MICSEYFYSEPLKALFSLALIICEGGGFNDFVFAYQLHPAEILTP